MPELLVNKNTHIFVPYDKCGTAVIDTNLYKIYWQLDDGLMCIYHVEYMKGFKLSLKPLIFNCKLKFDISLFFENYDELNTSSSFINRQVEKLLNLKSFI